MAKLEKRDDRPAFTVSVVVPCAHVHVQHLSGLLAALQAQTRRPDQIIFAVSGGQAAELPTLDAEVIHSPQKHTAGSNRNRGGVAARGDVVVYQDADDLPHPQRIEIVAALFEKYQIDHLMHFYNRSAERPEEFALKKALKRAKYRTSSTVGGVTNGNPAVARALLNVIRWPEHPNIGEDLEFNAEVLKHTKRTAVIDLPLLTYRQNFSSFGPAFGR